MGETKRSTVSLPEEKYQELRDQLDTFSTDTARFQHLVELFLNGRLRCPLADGRPEAVSELAGHSENEENEDQQE